MPFKLLAISQICNLTILSLVMSLYLRQSFTMFIIPFCSFEAFLFMLQIASTISTLVVSFLIHLDKIIALCIHNNNDNLFDDNIRSCVPSKDQILTTY